MAWSLFQAVQNIGTQAAQTIARAVSGIAALPQVQAARSVFFQPVQVGQKPSVEHFFSSMTPIGKATFATAAAAATLGITRLAAPQVFARGEEIVRSLPSRAEELLTETSHAQPEFSRIPDLQDEEEEIEEEE